MKQLNLVNHHHTGVTNAAFTLSKPAVKVKLDVTPPYPTVDIRFCLTVCDLIT